MYYFALCYTDFNLTVKDLLMYIALSYTSIAALNFASQYFQHKSGLKRFLCIGKKLKPKYILKFQDGTQTDQRRHQISEGNQLLLSPFHLIIESVEEIPSIIE